MNAENLRRYLVENLGRNVEVGICKAMHQIASGFSQFVLLGERFIRIDWGSEEPTEDQTKRAEELVKKYKERDTREIMGWGKR